MGGSALYSRFIANLSSFVFLLVCLEDEDGDDDDDDEGTSGTGLLFTFAVATLLEHRNRKD